MNPFSLINQVRVDYFFLISEMIMFNLGLMHENLCA